MIRFKYRYCKVHMARFVAGDLSLAARRKIGRYIDECPDCYRLYNRHREFNRNLSRHLPALGNPNQRRLDNMWAALQNELIAPERPAAGISDFGRRSSLQFSYGLAAVAVCLAMLLPIAAGYRGSLSAVESPPAPHAVASTETSTTGTASMSTAAATAQPVLVSPAQLMNTPDSR